MDNRPQSRVKRVEDKTVKVEKKKIENKKERFFILKSIFGNKYKKWIWEEDQII